MNVRELLAACRRDRVHFQLHVNGFVDEFRRATAVARAAMVASGPTTTGPFEGLAAAVVSALCRETGVEAPTWVAHTASPEPFFVLPARSFPLRLRLMLESPPPFRAPATCSFPRPIWHAPERVTDRRRRSESPRLSAGATPLARRGA